jgi:hypothetical protein
MVAGDVPVSRVRRGDRRSRSRRTPGESEPDVPAVSLRGSAVLRWEYRPGSTVYFVWTQQRTGFDPVGTFDFGSAASAIFRDRPINLFQVKVNYWIGR